MLKFDGKLHFDYGFSVVFRIDSSWKGGFG